MQPSGTFAKLSAIRTCTRLGSSTHLAVHLAVESSPLYLATSSGVMQSARLLSALLRARQTSHGYASTSLAEAASQAGPASPASLEHLRQQLQQGEDLPAFSSKSVACLVCMLRVSCSYDEQSVLDRAWRVRALGFHPAGSSRRSGPG